MKKELLLSALAAILVATCFGTTAANADNAETNADMIKTGESTEIKTAETDETIKTSETIETIETDKIIETDESIEADETTTEPNDSAELTAKEIEMEEWAAENKTVLEEIPRFEQNGMVIRTAEDALICAPYETTFLPKYRDSYYWGPSFLYDMVDQDVFAEWYETVVRPDYCNNAEPKEMYTVSFVKYFEISREDFERCCEQKRKRLEYLRDELGHDINVEGAEIPNADIIYTFDNEIINNYYLRDQEGIIYTPADEY